ncbi:MAG: FG-GAP repeat protein [Deltaproteobacteria bacterium]|nr:FG-GAP repeat protein [Deltaproteobacteria bacterium]
MRPRLDVLAVFLVGCQGSAGLITVEDLPVAETEGLASEIETIPADSAAAADTGDVPRVDPPLYDTGDLQPPAGGTTGELPDPLDTAERDTGTPDDTAAPHDTATLGTADSGRPDEDTAPSDTVDLACYLDADGDGFGDPGSPVSCISGDPTTVSDNTDCDDTSAMYHVGASEWCDGIDNDCNGVADDDYAIDATVWYADADADTYGDVSVYQSACDAPPGHVESHGDCDDGDGSTSPEGVEVCDGMDNDCSGVADDNDAGCASEPGPGDEGGGEAADTPADTGGGSPAEDSGDSALPEVLDTASDSGGGGTAPEEEDPGTPTPEDCTGTWYADADGDGYGDPLDAVTGCAPDDSYVRNDDDCDGSDVAVNPESEEACDGQDNDCDGVTDEADAEDAPPWYGDHDGDGYGIGSDMERACDAPTGYVADAGDCDDADDMVSPSGVEVCDGIDNDCNEGADEVSAIDVHTWYFDSDGDGYGGLLVRTACTQPADAYPTSDDCNDNDATVSPAGTEVCNDVDDDCNGSVDDGATAGAQYWYADADGDDYGDAGSPLWSCSTPLGYVADDTDCDDSDPGASPAHSERCDDVDNDCDGDVDELGAVAESTWYQDADGDGHGDRASTTEACNLPAGYAESRDDCDDADAGAFPGNTEVCGDGVDNDCDGVSDLCGPWGERDIDAADAQMYGESPGDDAGRAVAFVGDLDADGADEIAVGGPLNDDEGTSAGVAWILSAPTAETLLEDAPARLLGETGDDYAGWSIAAAGDVDGDGFGDVILGAYSDGIAGVDAGAAYVVTGPVSGDIDLPSQRAVLTGVTAVDWAGYDVDSVVDDDGSVSLLVGAPYEDQGGSKAGAVYVVDSAHTGSFSLAGAEAKLVGEVSLDRAGAALASTGDVDGDGLGDLVVGAWGDSTVGSRSGAAYVLLGPVAGTIDLSAADAKWIGESTGDRAGWSVDGGADLDGDGLDDTLVGAPIRSRSYVVPFASSGTQSLAGATAVLADSETSNRAGTTVATGGDVDGDGWAEVAIGATSENLRGADTGAVYLVRGPFSGSIDLADADGLLHGLATRDTLGASMAIDGDANGDGNADVLVGAPGNDDNGAESGAAYLFYGI